MQAIETKYLGPTNHRGARIKVSAQCGSMTVPYDYASNSGDHQYAVRAFALKMGWFGRWVCAHRADGRGMVAVCVKRFRYGKVRPMRVTVVTP